MFAVTMLPHVALRLTRRTHTLVSVSGGAAKAASAEIVFAFRAAWRMEVEGAPNLKIRRLCVVSGFLQSILAPATSNVFTASSPDEARFIGVNVSCASTVATKLM